MYKYVCPKCRARMESQVPLIYCVCGGKYVTPLDDIMAMAESMFGKDNPFFSNFGRK